MSATKVEIDVEKIRATEAAILVRDADDNQIWGCHSVKLKFSNRILLAI